MVPMDGGRPHPLINSEFDETDPAVSPDGQWLAFDSDRSGVKEIYVRRIAGGRVVQISGVES